MACLEMACLGLRRLRRWVKPLTLPAKSFTKSASFKWCAKSLPNELLQRHAGVSVTRFACGQPRSANQTRGSFITSPNPSRKIPECNRPQAHISRHSRAEVAPLRRANASAFHRLFGALNDFADWLACRFRSIADSHSDGSR